MRFHQTTLLMLMVFLTLPRNTIQAQELPECTDPSEAKPFLVLTEFSSNRLLSEGIQDTQKVLHELLGSSLLRRTATGYQSDFFSSWQSNDSSTIFDLFLNAAYGDKQLVNAIEKAIRTTLFDSGIFEGSLAFDEKKRSFHLESKSQRPRLFDYLTQIYPVLSSDRPPRYAADGPYRILCQKFEGTVLRLKRQKPHATYPELIDISGNDIDYNQAAFVLSPLFSDKFSGFYENHPSKHRTSMAVLTLNAKNKASRSEHFRKLLSCSVNQIELSQAYESSFLDHPFYPIKPLVCDKKTRAQLLNKIPKASRNQALFIAYDGHEPPAAKVLEQELKNSGLKISIRPSRQVTNEIGKILSIPIPGFEPALAVKSLCMGQAERIPECRGLALRAKLLSYQGQDMASLVSPLFVDHSLIPLFYIPYKFLARRSVIDRYEERATELLNLDGIGFSPVGK